MPSIRFREDMSPQDIIAIVSMATLSVIAFTEATAFTIFVTYTERKNPKREPSLIHRIFNKFNVLLLTMFIMSLIWSICACYSITRTHSNLSLIAPQSVETFSSAIIEICFIHCCWAISVSILRRNSGPIIFRVASIIVTLAPFVFLAQATLYIIALHLDGAPISKIIITADKILALAGGLGEIAFCVYLVYVFTKTLFQQRKDLDDITDVSSKSLQSTPTQSNSIVGEDSRKQQRQFRTISRHGIASCLFCFLAVAAYAMELVNGLEEWINVFQVVVHAFLNCAFLTLFVMKVRLEYQRNNGGRRKERSNQAQTEPIMTSTVSNTEQKASFIVEPVRSLLRNSFNGKATLSSQQG